MRVARSAGYEALGFGPSLPCDWIVKGGRPAAIIGDAGMASFEDDEDGRLLVLDLLLAQRTGLTYQLFSNWYGTACILAPGGPCPLWHHENARWMWRPNVYRLGYNGWQGFGSQQELGWRHAMNLIQHVIHGGAMPDEVTAREEAIDRAEALLRRHLTPFQEFEYVLTSQFRCRGAATGNWYLIESSSGFAILDPVSNTKAVSYCLHPENWIPHADIQLATKLALEDEELEIECLENARQIIMRPSPALPEDRVAHEFEKELLPHARSLEVISRA